MFLSSCNSQNEVLYKRTVRQEDYSKKNNLVMTGIEEKRAETSGDCEEKVRKVLLDKLQITDVDKIMIQDCHRIGFFKAGRTRPVVIRFLDLKDKNSIYKLRKKLIENKSESRISEHFSQDTTAIRKALGPIVGLCIKKGKKATLIQDEILVEGKRYNIDNIHHIPDIDTQQPCTKANNKVLAFNGRLSYLSNFHSANFFTEDILFCSNEQFYQYKRAQSAGTQHITANILATKDPVTQKKLGETTQFNYDDWDSYDTMKKGAIAKFSQNKRLLEFLKSTEGLELLHTNEYDHMWGTDSHSTTSKC